MTEGSNLERIEKSAPIAGEGGAGAVILEHSKPVPTWVMKSDWGQISSKCLTTSRSPQFYMWAKLIRLGNFLQAFAKMLTQFFSL